MTPNAPAPLHEFLSSTPSALVGKSAKRVPSVVSRILMVTSTALLVSSLAGGVSAYLVASATVEDEVRFAGELLTSTLSGAITTIINKPGAGGELQVALNGVLRRDTENRITDAFVLDRDMRVLAAREQERVGSHLSKQKQVLRHITSTQIISNDDLGRAVVSPVQWGKKQKRTLGYVVLGLSERAFEEIRGRIVVWFASIFVVTLGISILVTEFVVKRMLRPVVDLGKAARELANGNFDFPLRIPSRRDEVGIATSSFARMREVQRIFVRFSNPALVSKIMAGIAPDQAEETHICVGFGDGVRFTQWSTDHSAAEISSRLSDYFTLAGLLVHSHNGLIEKFIGDAIMSYFGFDETQVRATSVRSALRSKITIQIAFALANYVFEKLHLQRPLTFRFGVASGNCVVGPLGARDVKLDYTIIGTTVNLASRLEALAQPGGLMIDSFSFRDAGAEQYLRVHESREELIKGFRRRIGVHSVAGFQSAEDARGVCGRLQQFFAEPRVAAVLKLDEKQAQVFERVLQASLIPERIALPFVIEEPEDPDATRPDT